MYQRKLLKKKLIKQLKLAGIVTLGAGISIVAATFAYVNIYSQSQVHDTKAIAKEEEQNQWHKTQEPIRKIEDANEQKKKDERHKFNRQKQLESKRLNASRKEHEKNIKHKLKEEEDKKTAQEVVREANSWF